MGVRERSDQFQRLVRSSLADLFDQRKPFGRLALTHVLMTGGDTLFAVSLAGSLFFSISPTAAKDKVLLYLLLTMGPFAVVAPALGPLIDRSRGARRAMVVASALGRAMLCPFVARDIHSLLLFPEAFLILVLSKVYLVTKGALVPEMAALGLLDETAPDGHQVAASDVADVADEETAEVLGGAGPVGRLSSSTPPYGTPVVEVEDPGGGPPRQEADLATLNARLGLLASLSGFAFALPGVLILKLAGAPAVLWSDVAVFAAAVVAGARLPVRRLKRANDERGARAAESVPQPVQLAPDEVGRWAGDAEDLAALGPIADPPVYLALMPMSVLKALLGFFTFLLAFGLRRQEAATWWFGLFLGALTAGALLGVLSVAWIRRVLSEPQMLTGALWLVAAVAGLGAVFTGRWFLTVVAFGIGVAGAVAKPSFDALVQRGVRDLDQGRAFARFETQLQLLWVLGSLVPVVLSLPIAAGNLVMAIVAAVGALSYLSSRRALRVRWGPAGAPAPLT